MWIEGKKVLTVGMVFRIVSVQHEQLRTTKLQRNVSGLGGDVDAANPTTCTKTDLGGGNAGLRVACHAHAGLPAHWFECLLLNTRPDSANEGPPPMYLNACMLGSTRCPAHFISFPSNVRA